MYQPVTLPELEMSHCLTCRLTMTAGLILLFTTTSIQAQVRSPELTTKTGTLVEVSTKGRAHTLTYTDDAGEEQTLIVTPRIVAAVQAPGDAEFLRPGQFIAALATESNEKLFAKEVSVLLFGKGRPPAGKIQKAPPKSGQSQNAYQVSGPIIAIGQDPDYPEYQRVEIKASGPKAPLMLEEGFTVTVKSQDFSLATKGTSIELEGVELKNGRFNITKVTAILSDPLKADEVLGSAAEDQE